MTDVCALDYTVTDRVYWLIYSYFNQFIRSFIHFAIAFTCWLFYISVAVAELAPLLFEHLFIIC